MPILESEPNLHPENLLDGNIDLEISPFERAWWVIYTRARQEKCLARDLRQREISFFLPLVQRRLLIRGRPFYSHVPLFSGYLFLFGTDEDRVRTLMTNRVAEVIPVSDPEQLVVDLRNVQRLIQTGAPLTVESRLVPNQRVRIRCGAMAGLEGIVMKRKNMTRLMVWVNLLQQGVSLEIDDYLLEPQP